MTKGKSPCEGPGCPALLAIGMIGSELKLGVLHSLLSGPKRFNELRLATGICQSSLAKTLKELEDSGIAERKVLLDRPVAVEYRLSPMGSDLFDAIRGLEHWGSRGGVGHLRPRRRRGPRRPGPRLDHLRGGPPYPRGSARERHGPGQGARLDGRKRPSGREGEPNRRAERRGAEPPAGRGPGGPP